MLVAGGCIRKYVNHVLAKSASTRPRGNAGAVFVRFVIYVLGDIALIAEYLTLGIVWKRK